MRRPILIAVAIVALVAILVFVLVRKRGNQNELSASGAAEAPPAEAPPPDSTPETPPLPDLDASDALLSQMMAEMGADPTLATRLSDDLIRTFVRLVDAVAEGDLPRRLVVGLAPEGEFAVREQAGGLVTSPASYERYDWLTEQFDAVSARSWVDGYRRVEPLAGQAFMEVGGTADGFRGRLLTAIDLLLATPLPSQPPRLVDVAVDRYEYVDPELESLRPAQKQLLRFGPANQQRIQTKLAQIRDLLLGLP